MSKAQLVITAVTVEKRPVSEVARAYGVARSWICTLLERYRTEGEAAFEPRPRRPKTSPGAISDGTIGLIVGLRKELAGQGLDAGPHTIRWHLRHHHQVTVSAATVSRYLTGAGLVTPEPKKRPKSSCLRFAAELPNECWQSDLTHYRLTRPDGSPGPDTEILGWLDDHSPLVLSLTAHRRVTGPIVVAAFRAAAALYGVPASTLTDNGMVFTTRFPGGKGGRNGLEHELRRLGIKQKNGRPNHPQTQGKVERFWQTLKKWLAATPPARHHQPTAGPARRLHQLRQPAAPPQVPAAPRDPRHRLCRPAQATPGDRTTDTHDRVRTDRIDSNGVVTLRHGGKLYHIGAGRTCAGTHIIMLVRDLDIRIAGAATGELLRQLTPDPSRNYQPTRLPPGPTPGTPRQRKHPGP